LQASGGDHAAARQTYQRIIAKFKLFAPAYKALAGLYAAAEDSSTEALETARKAREWLPKDPEVARSLGVLALVHGDYEWARQLLEESAKSRPGDADVIYQRGRCAAALKNVGEAKRLLTEALAAKPDAPWAEKARELLRGL
jgi:tetratricopeptide (TPR) repeat protein